ncbi:MAG: hypothetical protein JWN03_5348 [Nocardia sp.]|uniref:hypothetical protein n=1 Tax=Nocardia sp. TaxID=1821 RepID=UPI0026041109|nr:hypothetical protein [Nocardia sp.]MCU1645073.1 hypothetical protein [Nocardia sp.]
MSIEAPEQQTPEQVSIGGWVARAVAVLIFLPLRLLWEGGKLAGRMAVAVLDYIVENLLVPVAKLAWYWIIRPAWAFVRNYLWGLLIQQLLWGMILTPLGAAVLDYFLRPIKRAVQDWLWRRVLRPALIWLVNEVIEPVATWIGRWILKPIAGATTWAVTFLVKWLIVWPLRRLWRWVLRPILLLLAATLVFGWQVATTVVRVLVVTPCRFLYRTVLQPLFAVIAKVWHTVVERPVRWLYLNVVTPMNKAASDFMSAIFDH